MRWTKEKSRNAVAKKERLRIARATADLPDEPVTNSYKLPRIGKPDFTIRIESARGERVCYKIRRVLGKVLIGDGLSVRQFCRGLEHLITKSA